MLKTSFQDLTRYLEKKLPKYIILYFHVCLFILKMATEKEALSDLQDNSRLWCSRKQHDYAYLPPSSWCRDKALSGRGDMPHKKRLSIGAQGQWQLCKMPCHAALPHWPSRAGHPGRVLNSLKSTPGYNPRFPSCSHSSYTHHHFVLL